MNTSIEWLLLAALAAALLSAVLTWLLLRGHSSQQQQTAQQLMAQLATLLQQQTGLSQQLPSQFERLRESTQGLLSSQRLELSTALTGHQQTNGQQLASVSQTVAQQTGSISLGISTAFEAFNQQLAKQIAHSQQQQTDLRAALEQRLAASASDARTGREEVANALARFREGFSGDLQALSASNSERLTELRGTVEARLKELQGSNETKLEAMRQTVDEKLHATLEARLGESFKIVSDRLEQVHRGLGEMQTLATGVGDLKRVLSNVKTRGGWGEVQLETLLEQSLTPAQFARSVCTKPGSEARVDFALKLPGRDEGGQPVWLPIDAKFPREDYERLVDAAERADAPAVDAAGKALEAAIRTQAKSIHDKYVQPPHTTDFALMFLPTEGLYAEVLRRPGLADALQHDYRITLAGPTTLTALLNSLQMGFRTLAIEKRSSEVWKVLGAVKTEFDSFGTVLGKVSEKLEQAQKQIEATGVRTRAIKRQLREVEALPAEQASALLANSDAAALEE